MGKNKEYATAAEKEVLEFLWEQGEALTAAEIVSKSNRTWKASYVHLIIQSLLKKELIEIKDFKKTTKNYARAFAPCMSKEEFLFHSFTQENKMDDQTILILTKCLLNEVMDPQTIDSIIAMCNEKRIEQS